MKAQIYSIQTTYIGQRIDNFLLRQLKGLPRSRIYHLLRKKKIRLNAKKVEPSYRLCLGDTIEVPAWLDEPVVHQIPSARDCERFNQRKLFENAHILIIDKPAGMAVHKGTGIPYGAIEIARFLYPKQEDLSLVHRLDRDTSGCLLFAKHYNCLTALHDLFRRGLVQKRYQALLLGAWPAEKKYIHVQAPLSKGRLTSGERMVVVEEDGQMAETTFNRVQAYQRATLVDVQTKTGRMHQIRAHAKYLKRPIAGDRKYGDRRENQFFRTLGLRRLFLHATAMRFQLPAFHLDIHVTCALPEALRTVLSELKKEDVNHV